MLLFERDRKGTIIGGGYCSKKQEGKNTRGGLLFLKRTTGEGQSKGGVVEQQTYPVRSEGGGGPAGLGTTGRGGGCCVVVRRTKRRTAREGRGCCSSNSEGKTRGGVVVRRQGCETQKGGGCCSPNWGTTTLPPPHASIEGVLVGFWGVSSLQLKYTKPPKSYSDH